jgi:hypothetical protein
MQQQCASASFLSATVLEACMLITSFVHDKKPRQWHLLHARHFKETIEEERGLVPTAIQNSRSFGAQRLVSRGAAGSIQPAFRMSRHLVITDLMKTR